MLTNNIHTITVGMLGVNGAIPNSALADASVLTSGLGYGSNITSSHFVSIFTNNDIRIRTLFRIDDLCVKW